MRNAKMKKHVGLVLLALSIGSLPLAEAKRPGKGKSKLSQAAKMGMPDLQSVLGSAYTVPLELSDRAMPGSILEVTPFGYRPIMSGCVGKEPLESTFTNITMQSSLSGGVSFGLGRQGASAKASHSVGLKFISPYILGFEMVDFEPSAECKGKMTRYAENKGYDNLVVVQEALFAKINGCSEISGSAKGKMRSVGGNASMRASCQMFSKEPVAVGVRLVDLTEFMDINQVHPPGSLVDGTASPLSSGSQKSMGVTSGNPPLMDASQPSNGFSSSGLPSVILDFDTILVHGGTYDNVRITHKIEVMQTEVTQSVYRTLMGKNPSQFKGDQLPVENISWFDAVEFANRLSINQGLTPCYEKEGFEVEWLDNGCTGWRLPTDAEWEYLARADENKSYSGGNDLDEVAWHGQKQTMAVASKAPNAFGLFDMSGNVSEWCWDYETDWRQLSVTVELAAPTVVEVASSPEFVEMAEIGASSSAYGEEVDWNDDPKGPSTGVAKIHRGGGWDYTYTRKERKIGVESPQSYYRIYNRHSMNPSRKTNAIGVRLVRSH